MDTARLKLELASLDAVSRRKIIAYLLSLDTQQNLGYQQLLADKIDSHEPSHWVAGEHLNQRLGLEE